MSPGVRTRAVVCSLVVAMLLGCSASSQRAAPSVSKASVAAGAKGDDVVVAFTLYSDDGDTMIGARVASNIAERTVLVNDREHDGKVGHVGHLDPGGSLGPERVKANIPGPAANAVTLGLGSEHVMLVDLVEPLRAGMKVPITLSFKESGDVTTTLTVH